MGLHGDVVAVIVDEAGAGQVVLDGVQGLLDGGVVELNLSWDANSRGIDGLRTWSARSETCSPADEPVLTGTRSR